MFPPSPEKVVREFWRLLKPGGVAITTTWHYNNAVHDFLSDLAHVFKGQGRFEDVPLAARTMKFGNEAFMRRLFRGDLDEGPTVWKDPDLEARFVPGSHPCLPRHMAATLNKNPVASELAPWDEGAAEAHLQEKWAGEDGTILLRGTALVLLARKPS
ncbi:Organellar oligopeptidase A [Durusdinium trenchii]|uniref:Chloroplastic/mitochondrial n=1 Tax=Durusdinium trenchii TaxID=1381693 RepID=A0ABP0K3U2_9DINO